MSKNIVLIKFYLVFFFFFVLNDTIFVKILNLKYDVQKGVNAEGRSEVKN